jgi:hypothetical protein
MFRMALPKQPPPWHSETQGRAMAALDAEEFCRASVIRDGGRPTMAVLDLVGWHRAGACGRSPRPKDVG